MSTAAVSELLYLLDAGFQGTDWHSLLGNLRAVTPADWLWVPPGGRRSIREIVQHVGGAKLIYHNRAFGDGQLPWDDPLVDGGAALDTIPSAVAWLRDGQVRLWGGLAALDDAALLQLRTTHFGKPREIRWFIMVMIQHDLYHAGEINHIRALCQGDDL